MQNEKCFYGYCNEFEYNHDFDTLEYDVLNNIVYSLFGVNIFTI